jgi:S-DNA-T family DNA segregation ATPase FtsK/SpoIIIE
MNKKERIAAMITGGILFLVAALFSIGIFLGILDFGFSPNKNFLVRLGEILNSVYGYCAILIPVFFFVAGAFCLSAKWSTQRAFILLVSIVPFFTLVLAERSCESIHSQDSSPVAVIKIVTLLVIAFLLVALEYLLAVNAASRVEKKITLQEIRANSERIRKIISSKIQLLKKNAKVAEEKIQPDDDGILPEENSEIPPDEEKNPQKNSARISAEKIDDDLEFDAPPKKVQGVWSIDSEGNIKGKTSDQTIVAFPQEDDYDDDEIELAEEIDEPEDLLNLSEEEDIEEDIIDQFEKNSQNFTEELQEAEEKNSAEKIPDETEEIDDDFFDDEPEADETENDDDEIYFEEEPAEENEIAEAEKKNPFDEDDMNGEISAEKKIDPDENEIDNDREILDDFAEDEFPEEKFTLDAPKNRSANFSKDSDLESVFSRMEADAKFQVENSAQNFRGQNPQNFDAENSENFGGKNSAQNFSEQNSQNFSEINSKNFGGENSANFDAENSAENRHRMGPYRISPELLTAYDENKYWVIDGETESAAKSLKETLGEFKIDAEVTGIRKGPVVTMFEILPAPGVKLSRIAALSDNIALRLAASSVRIVAPIPGKRAVGIEVPNSDRAIVSFRECIEQQRPEWKKMAVPVVLGKDIQGENQIIDLVKTPHLLIAGSTGAGKSVCVNSMILSILYKKNPQEVKMILIDPKIVELKLYNGIPHLLTPVITEPKRAMQALQYCLCEMERRYAVLDGMGCRDISSYNKKIVDQKIATEKLPYMIVIIDEFADLMATTGKELEGVVARLAAMSRAVGIHLVLATQRPSVDVITGLIKANIPSRIAFMVAAKTDSRIIIDQTGAEKLLGKGDMLYASATDPFPVRIQGAFVSDQEVENVVSAVKEWGEPEYIDDEIFVDDDEDENQIPVFGEGSEDPLYEKALDIVIQAGKASASYIQRRLSIGYNRAARLVEEMEERGIVGPANGSKPREIIHMP